MWIELCEPMSDRLRLRFAEESSSRRYCEVKATPGSRSAFARAQSLGFASFVALDERSAVSLLATCRILLLVHKTND